MSRFSRPEFTLALAGAHALLRSRTWFQPAWFPSAWFPSMGLRNVPAREWTLAGTSAEERLAAALSELPEGPASLSLFLPTRDFLFWSVPWVDSQLQEADWHDLAGNLLRQDFDRDPAQLTYTLSPARFGEDRLACGIAAATVDALRRQLPAEISLAGVHPLISLAWPRLLEAPGPVLYSEPGLAALLLPGAPGPRLHCRRLPGDQLADADTATSLTGLYGVNELRKFQLQLRPEVASPPGFAPLPLAALVGAG